VKYIPIPIELHDNNQEGVSFLLFKKSANSLKDEEERLVCLKDLCILCCDNPNHIAPFGYQKIMVDIR